MRIRREDQHAAKCGSIGLASRECVTGGSQDGMWVKEVGVGHSGFELKMAFNLAYVEPLDVLLHVSKEKFHTEFLVWLNLCMLSWLCYSRCSV